MLCSGNAAVVEELVTRGAEIDPLSDEGETPLHRAARKHALLIDSIHASSEG